MVYVQIAGVAAAALLVLCRLGQHTRNQESRSTFVTGITLTPNHKKVNHSIAYRPVWRGQKVTVPLAGENVEQQERSCAAGGSVK